MAVDNQLCGVDIACDAGGLTEDNHAFDVHVAVDAAIDFDGGLGGEIALEAGGLTDEGGDGVVDSAVFIFRELNYERQFSKRFELKA